MTYQVFFNLDDAPFNLTPDPDYYFPSKRHNEALETLIYCVESGEGFALISGQPGVGKTLLIRSFLNKLSDNVNTALILHPGLDAEDLFKVILEDLGLAPENMQGMSKESLLRSFRDILLESANRGMQTLVIIDEAQEIPERTLEELRLLSNLETNKAKLLQIILVGQLEIEDKLNQDNFKQLRQRITIRYRLDPLTLDETVNYIHHRLKVAGGGTVSRFSPKIIKQIHQISNGIPRIINTLCERSLMAAFVDGKSSINSGHLQNAAESLGHKLSHSEEWRKKTRLLFFLSTILVLAGIASYFLNAPVRQLIDLKTGQFITYLQTKKRAFNNSSQKEAVEIENVKKESIKTSENTEQNKQTLTVAEDTVNNKSTPPAIEAAEGHLAASGGKKDIIPVTHEDPDIFHKEPIKHEENEDSTIDSPDLTRQTDRSQNPGVEKKPVALAGQQVSSEIPVNPVALPPGWNSIIIQQKTQKALLYQSNNHVPVRELTLPEPVDLDEGIYLLGQNKGTSFLFNHRSFFAWQINSPLSRLLFKQFADDQSPPVIPVVVSSTEPENVSSQMALSGIRAMVKSWAAAYSQKDTQEMMRYYGDSLIEYKLFRNNPAVKSHAQVAAKKATIFEKNKAVFLQISEAVCMVNSKDPSQAIAFFRQRFVSSSYHDSGIKVLYLRKTEADTSENPGWVITGTLWFPSEERKPETLN